MALTKADKETIRNIVGNAVMSALASVKEDQKQCQSHVLPQIQKHELTLYGATGDNGLNGDMKGVKQTVFDYAVFKKEIYAYAAGIAGTVSFIFVVANFVVSKLIH